MTHQEPSDPAASSESLAALLDQDDATNRMIARHPNSGSALLEKLSHSSDRTTRALVAANPDVPLAVYLRLGAQFPSEFLANPILDLLFLENPALLQELPDNLLVPVLRKPNCPQSFLIWAAAQGSEKVQLAVAMNAKAPQQAIDRLRNSIYMAVTEAVSHQKFMRVDAETAEPLFRQAVKDWLGSLSYHDTQTALEKKEIGLAQLPYLETPVRLLLAGVKQGHLFALSQDTAWLEQLIRHLGDDFRYSVARDPTSTTAVLAMLAKDQVTDVRSEIASNPNTPIALLEVLATDKDESVRSCVPFNSSTPVALVEAMTKGLNAKARSYFAQLVQDRETVVRVRPPDAKRPNSPITLLKVLSASQHGITKDNITGFEHNRVSGSVVAKHANTPVDLLEALASYHGEFSRRNVAEHPDTPAVLLEVLATDEHTRVRSSAAKHANTPIALLEVLATDEQTLVRSSVANNPRTPEAILQRLVNDDSSDVRCAVCINVTTPPALADMARHVLLYGDLRQDPWYRDALNKADAATKAAVAEDNLLFFQVEDPDRRVLSTRMTAKLAALCSGPYVTPDHIARVSSSTDWLIRAAVARNAGTPPNLLRKLTADGHPLVAGLAKLALGRDTQSSAEVKYAHPGLRIDRIVAELISRLKALHDKPFSRDNVWGRLCTVSDVWVESKSAVGYLRQQMEASEWERLWLIRAKHKQLEYREKVAGSTDIPATALAVLARDGASEVRCAVAENTCTHLDIIAGLAKDRSVNVRVKVAKNPVTPVALLATLLKSKDRNIRSGLAENQNTPAEMLELLSRDEDIEVRGYVALNPHTTVEVLKVLAKDKEWDVRSAVAQNSRTPASVLEVLAKKDKGDCALGVANNLNTPVAVLKLLANHKYSYVRSGVALNPNTPFEVLENLAKDNFIKVRINVAKNPNTPAAVIDVMAKDEDSEVRRNVEVRRNTAVTVIKMLVESEESVLPGYLVDIRQALEMDAQLESGFAAHFTAVGPDDILRGVILLGALSSHADNVELTKASRSTDWLIRLGAVFHFNASDSQLKLLSQDTDPDVASAAMSRLRATIPTAHAKLAILVAPCPTCKGLVKERREDYTCVGAEDGQQGQSCGFMFKKTFAGRTFTMGEAELLVREGKIGPLTGFISKTGASFAAQMCFMFNNSSQNYRLQFDFGKDIKSVKTEAVTDFSNQISLGQCPKCSSSVYEQEKNYVCINSVVLATNPKPRCDFKTGHTVLQQAGLP
jgi:hypothetical protein